MQQNETKAKLQAGGTVLGCFFRYPSPSIVELMGYASWDFIVFDGEHGTIQPEDVENMVRAAELRHITPIVRATTNQPAVILRYMDTGAQGLHVPWVNSGEEAEQVVQATKYYPRGIRGLAGVRASNYAQSGTFAEYAETANRETLVVVHIETRQAVEHVEAIAAVEGVDVIFIGPTDLSHSYGVPGQPQHPDVQAAMDRVVTAVAASPAALGIMVANAEAAAQWRERGARYITVGFDGLLMGAMRGYLKNVRG